MTARLCWYDRKTEVAFSPSQNFEATEPNVVMHGSMRPRHSITAPIAEIVPEMARDDVSVCQN